MYVCVCVCVMNAMAGRTKICFTCVIFKFRNYHFDTKFFDSSYVCTCMCTNIYVFIYI